MKTRPTALFTVALLTVATTSFGADWPGWRGPNRDARSTETGLLATWPAEGPPKLWSASGFGTGFSSVAVAGGMVFTLGDLADGQYLIAAREQGGAIAWKVRLGPIWEDDFPGSRSTPTVGGGRVFALGTEGDLVAADVATGKELWRRNILRDFGGVVMSVSQDAQSYSWKVSESPLLDGERLIVTPGSKDAMLVALEVATGKEVWRTKIDRDLGPLGADGTAYSSAVVSNAGGVRQIVQLVGRGLVGVEATTGKLLWHYNKVANNVANIPTPLVHGDVVFTSTGYQTGAALLEISSNADGRIEARERYFLPAATFQNHHGNMVLHDGYVYAGTGHNRGYPIALELGTGKVAWGPASNKGTGSAAVVWAENRLYMRYQNGIMVLVETTPAGYQEAGSFTIPNVVRQSWSHPVIAGGVLYLREQDALHAYDLRQPAAPAVSKVGSPTAR